MKPSAYHSGETEADNSQTPWWLIRQLQDITNLNFVHDICARENSVKSSSGSFWSKEDNALIIDWANDQFPFGANLKDACWMNPPFSMAKEFNAKAAHEAQKGVVTLGCCVHAPDRNWFIELEKQATFIYVPDRRIQFLTHEGKPFTRIDKRGKTVSSGANFPLCFPLFTPFNNGGEAKQIRFICDKERYS